MAGGAPVSHWPSGDAPRFCPRLTGMHPPSLGVRPGALTASRPSTRAAPPTAPALHGAPASIHLMGTQGAHSAPPAVPGTGPTPPGLCPLSSLPGVPLTLWAAGLPSHRPPSRLHTSLILPVALQDPPVPVAFSVISQSPRWSTALSLLPGPVPRTAGPQPVARPEQCTRWGLWPVHTGQGVWEHLGGALNLISLVQHSPHRSPHSRWKQAGVSCRRRPPAHDCGPVPALTHCGEGRREGHQCCRRKGGILAGGPPLVLPPSFQGNQVL